jgi:hypothetical protein
MLLLSSESFSEEGGNLITKAHNVSQMAALIFYVAIKLRNKCKNGVSPERSEGGAMNQLIKKLKKELNLFLKVSRTLNLIVSGLAICYLLFAHGAHGFHPISQLNND